jgi:hypothetical protein
VVGKGRCCGNSRLHTNVVGPHVDRPESLPVPPLPVDPDLDEYADPRTEVAAWLEAVRLAGPRPWLDHICSSLIQSATRQVVQVATGSNSASSRMYVLRGRRPVADESWRNVGLEFDGGDLTNSFIGRAVELTSHCDGVGALAGQFAASCGLPQHLIDDLTLAGRLHDLGKADPRFQVWLCDGDEIAASRCGVLRSATNWAAPVGPSTTSSAGHPGRSLCLLPAMVAGMPALRISAVPVLLRSESIMAGGQAPMSSVVVTPKSASSCKCPTSKR